VVFDHPSPRAVAEFLRAELVPDPVSVAVAGIDRLRAAVAELGADDEARAAVARRLEALLADLEGAEGSRADTVGRIHAATGDEILDIIDRGL
ncbi:MAG: hypothetical protein LPK27_11070, partial [Rhodococcus sp. (in: high G+C Gram-positive bacteria)]|nr:hypothetical protein [Rhodococcus sp. (in: high G+C Gram-positive bacteria)]